MFETFEHILGVELTLLQNETYRCGYAVVTRKGDNIDAADYHTVEGNLVKVLERIPRKYPVALSINGKGIIHKQLKGAGTDTKDLFRAAFSSVERKDFYVQEAFSGDLAWVSIVRQTFVDDIVAKLQSSGLNVYMLSLGALPVISIWELLSGAGEGFSANGHQFEVAVEGNLIAYRYGEGAEDKGSLKLGNTKLKSTLLVPYALAFQLFLHDKLAVVKVENEQVDNRFEDFLEFSKLKKTAGIFIFVLLGLLVISFFALTHYNAENAKLNQQVGAITATADQSDLLKKEIANQKISLEKLGWNGGYSYAFLLNEIGSSKPRALTLNDIQFDRLKESAENKDALASIKISGETSNLSAVNNWIFLLKEKKWAKEVKLLRYQQDTESENFAFNLLIQY
ncbi:MULTISPECIES: hypothetical protein [unclassified Pedobacter]|uniref:hypothetical protein n=1 Tax=unclassified Pedobacter TaxID=2628915 RepID=UPI00141F4867|nr:MULTISPECIES: hypothetical protein [unclassified Pedobacter]NII83274.1 hypothetical protein [Pedobacter sp. SG908]NMN37144.1 hypothetical protein [Pedobacter sp. SG918]